MCTVSCSVAKQDAFVAREGEEEQRRGYARWWKSVQPIPSPLPSLIDSFSSPPRKLRPRHRDDKLLPPVRAARARRGALRGQRPGALPDGVGAPARYHLPVSGAGVGRCWFVTPRFILSWGPLLIIRNPAGPFLGGKGARGRGKAGLKKGEGCSRKRMNCVAWARSWLT